MPGESAERAPIAASSSSSPSTTTSGESQSGADWNRFSPPPKPRRSGRKWLPRSHPETSMAQRPLPFVRLLKPWPPRKPSGSGKFDPRDGPVVAEKRSHRLCRRRSEKTRPTCLPVAHHPAALLDDAHAGTHPARVGCMMGPISGPEDLLANQLELKDWRIARPCPLSSLFTVPGKRPPVGIWLYRAYKRLVTELSSLD